MFFQTAEVLSFELIACLSSLIFGEQVKNEAVCELMRTKLNRNS